LKAGLKSQLADGIYMGGSLRIEKDGSRRRIVLKQGGGSSLAAGSWSAGQREFTPLLLGLYWLMPASKITKREDVQTVIIEEPEMGLHPRAIIGFGLLVFELLARGYSVVVSTHSPVVLDLVWAMQELRNVREAKALRALKQIFRIKALSAPLKRVLVAALETDYRTYFFDRAKGGVISQDISSLDPGSSDPKIAGWGGLAGFSGAIADAVGEAVV
jgi:hypothetical protein